jgi:2-polyprenyl-3-methyl-5-hydroxy-6-metoxy-1,4-benzoquinol methylase
MIKYIKNFFRKLMRPRGRTAFLLNLKSKSIILDVGCGNNSASKIKKILSDCYYVGIDVSNYNNDELSYADEYILTSPEEFSNRISKEREKFDAVISAHNLEHCQKYEKTIQAIVSALKGGGKMYLSFPSEGSLNFPSRNGTLNYYDDPSHSKTIPKYQEVINILKSQNMEIIYSTRSYKPIFLFFIGAIIEPLASKIKKNLIGTWEFYGFETIIWAQKKI